MKPYSAREICQAVERYYALTNDLRQPGFWNWLELDLGDCGKLISKPNGIPDTIFQIPDKAVHRIDLLLSTHYRTLFKAYQIKHGNNHDNKRSHCRTSKSIDV